MNHSPSKSDDAVEAAEFSLRQIVGWVLAVLLGLALLWAPPVFGLDKQASQVTLLAILMAVLWLTESIPIPVTALLPLVLLPLLGVSTIRESAAPFADPIIYLFMGGFLLAIAMEKWDLHKRVALSIISMVGTKPRSIALGFLITTTFLSMWTSNSATAMMMLPIGISVYALLKNQGHHAEETSRMGVVLVLAIAYGANIGGMTVITSTPPNMVLKAHMQNHFGIEIGFVQWMMFGVPLAIVALPLVHLILTRVCFRLGDQEIKGVKEVIGAQRKALGKMSWAEWAVCLAFGLAMTLWISRELWKQPAPKLPGEAWTLGALITDEVIAIGCALLLFMVPSGRGKGSFILDSSSLQKIPWHVLILFGGGLSLAGAMEKVGLITSLATAMQGMGGWHPLLIVFIVTAVMIVATAFTSNTATATAFLPVIAGLAIGIDVPVMLLAVPVAIAASADFALPVGTPPNAVAYGSGIVSLPKMVKAGIWVDLLFALLIPLMMWSIGRWVYGL